MKKLVIPGDLVQALANYLATKPYAEVAGLIDALKKLSLTESELKVVDK